MRSIEPLPLRKLSQDLSIRNIRSNSKLSSCSKEMSYYVNQKLGARLQRNLAQAMESLESFRAGHK